MRKTKRGDTFYGCVKYPKCDFASNIKLVNEPCPKKNSSYLLEYTNAEGTFMVCPHNHEALPKKRTKKGAPEEPAPEITCTYKKKIAEPAPVPFPEPEKAA